MGARNPLILDSDSQTSKLKSRKRVPKNVSMNRQVLEYLLEHKHIGAAPFTASSIFAEIKEYRGVKINSVENVQVALSYLKSKGYLKSADSRLGYYLISRVATQATAAAKRRTMEQTRLAPEVILELQAIFQYWASAPISAPISQLVSREEQSNIWARILLKLWKASRIQDDTKISSSLAGTGNRIHTGNSRFDFLVNF